MLLACKEVSRLKIPVICVDDSPVDVFPKLKEKLETESSGWIRVSKFSGTGKKGASLRQAIRESTQYNHHRDRSATVFTELEKVNFFSHLHHVVQGILTNQTDIVTPMRNAALFQSTYALEQYLEEAFGNRHINLSWKRHVPRHGQDLDWLFGPICWESKMVSPIYLQATDCETWNAQMVPAIRAYFSSPSLRWNSVEIDYMHPPEMKLEEEGSLEFSTKRVMQVNLLCTELPERFLMTSLKKRILLCGAGGNLGTRLIHHFRTNPELELVVMDKQLPSLRFPDVTYVQADFVTLSKQWTSLFRNAHTVFLLAARNPFWDANSEEVFDSMRITCNLLEASAEGNVNRIVYASSNHVLGKELQSDTPTLLEPDQTPHFGTSYVLDHVHIDSTLYASAKVAGEAQIRAMVDFGRLKRAIILRIGFVQSGENKFETINATGTSREKDLDLHDSKRVKSELEERVLKWYQGMHLKTEDLNMLVDACISDRVDKSEKKLIYCNGVSRNPHSRWVIGSKELDFFPA